MTQINSVYLVPTIISLLAVLYPAPWHIRTRNLATLSMIFWMTALNIVHLVNCIVWSDNTDIKASVWGDISTTVIVGYNFALPLSHLLLAKTLEMYTSLRPTGPLYDHVSRTRHRRFDLCVAILGPILGILLHLSMMDRRFYVVEKFGPMPATWWDTWGVIWMAIVPVVIAFGCLVYTIMALVNIHLRRQQMLTIIASDASVNREQFYRLLFLALAELGTCILRAVFNLLAYQNGPQPLGHRGPPEHNLARIETIPWSDISTTGHAILNLQFFTVVACSFVFFFCFATSTETKRFYRRITARLIPCVDEEQQPRALKLSSIDSGASRSTRASTTLHDPKVPVSPSTTTTAHSPWTPHTPNTPYVNTPYVPYSRSTSPGNAKLDDTHSIRLGSSVQGSTHGDMSLLEMLDSPAPNRHELRSDAAWRKDFYHEGREEFDAM